MSRFKHPIRAIREPFGTAGLIVACIALVLALTGAAFAAAGLNGKQKKEVKSIAKQFAGQPGAPGAAGPQGPKGDPGAAGSNGAPGVPGANGATGPTGKTGVTGVTGATGPTGMSGFTETLPPGKTETGSWTAVWSGENQDNIFASSISYSIPLSEPSTNAVILNREETEGSTTTPVNGCEFELENPAAVPVAPPGTLCVFVTEEATGSLARTAVPGETGESGDSPVGTILLAKTSPGGKIRLGGVWAVTAEE
jgi:Collagen triple helix repeat (20 copies)